MVDTFAPLELGEGGLAAEDPAYAWTWAGRGPAPGRTHDGRRRSGRLLQLLSPCPDDLPYQILTPATCPWAACAPWTYAAPFRSGSGR